MQKSLKIASSLALAVAAMLPMFASAQSNPLPVPNASTYFAENNGRVSVQTSANAAVNGNGGSLTHAEVSASSYSNGAISQTPAGIAIVGAVGGDVKAMGYNIKTFDGVGSFNAGGWSDASFVGNASLVIPTGYVTGSLNIDGGMGNAVKNGVDAHVVGSTATDGFAQGTYAGSGALVGTVAQAAIPGGAAIAGSVVTTQTSDVKANAGAVTFDGGAPAGQTAAVRFANSGLDIDVRGQFDDPATVSLK